LTNIIKVIGGSGDKLPQPNAYIRVFYMEILISGTDPNYAHVNKDVPTKCSVRNLYISGSLKRAERDLTK